MELRIDFHVHSHYSSDSAITPEQLAVYVKERGLDAVAITDHDNLDGGRILAREMDFLVVPGVEISSADGHVIALDVREPVRKGLSANETVERIHEAGGFAIACHPSSVFKKSLGRHVTERFDAVESINASSIPFGYAVKRNRELASYLRKPCTGGSDAHYGPEIGYACTYVEAEPNTASVIRALSRGLCRPVGWAIPWNLRIERIWAVNRRKLAARRERKKRV